MTYQQQDHQHFEIRERRHGKVTMVDVMTWFGDSNKSGISVYLQNLKDLRDKINDYLEEYCDCDWEEF